MVRLAPSGALAKLFTSPKIVVEVVVSILIVELDTIGSISDAPALPFVAISPLAVTTSSMVASLFAALFPFPSNVVLCSGAPVSAEIFPTSLAEVDESSAANYFNGELI